MRHMRPPAGGEVARRRARNQPTRKPLRAAPGFADTNARPVTQAGMDRPATKNSARSSPWSVTRVPRLLCVNISRGRDDRQGTTLEGLLAFQIAERDPA